MAFHLRLRGSWRGNYAHCCLAEDGGERAVFELTHYNRTHGLGLEPMFQRASQISVVGWHQKRQPVEAFGKACLRSLRDAGMSKEAQTRLSKQVTECPDLPSQVTTWHSMFYSPQCVCCVDCVYQFSDSLLPARGVPRTSEMPCKLRWGQPWPRLRQSCIRNPWGLAIGEVI